MADLKYYNGKSWESVGGGGGSGGTSDYTALTNKPQINGVTLSGNRTSAALGLADAEHTHDVADVSGAAKTEHTHSVADIEGLTPSATSAPVLLWSQTAKNTNAMTIPTSQIHADFSKYMFFAVRMCLTSSDTNGGYQIVKKDSKARLMSVGQGSTHYAYSRDVTITSSGIEFAQGYRNGTANAQYAVPLEVWGVW